MREKGFMVRLERAIAGLKLVRFVYEKEGMADIENGLMYRDGGAAAGVWASALGDGVAEDCVVESSEDDWAKVVRTTPDTIAISETLTAAPLIGLDAVFMRLRYSRRYCNESLMLLSKYLIIRY